MLRLHQDQGNYELYIMVVIYLVYKINMVSLHFIIFDMKSFTISIFNFENGQFKILICCILFKSLAKQIGYDFIEEHVFIMD